MPVDIHDTHLVDNLVALELLDWHDCRAFKLVIGHLAIKDLQRAVVTGVCEQRKSALVEPHGADGLWMESHCLVWPVGQVKVVPEQPPIVTADNQVIAARVNVK